MSSKQIIRKRGRINVVACNKCKRDKKKCDGSYLTQKPCKYCRDRNEYCEYTEPNRLRLNKSHDDIGDNVVISESPNINDEIMNETFSNKHHDDNNNNLSQQQQQQQQDTNLNKSDFFQLLIDPSYTNEQTIILKRLVNEIMKNPQDSKFIGNKRDELFLKLKFLSTSNNNNDHMKIQIWNDLYSFVNELDKFTKNSVENNNSNILDSIFDNFNSWNPETLGFSPSIINNNSNNNNTSTTIDINSSTISQSKVESQHSNLIFSNNNDQLSEINSTTILNDQQKVDKPKLVPNVRKNQKVKIIRENKNTNDTKKRKSRKNQKGNKRTQPYPAGGQIVIRPSKQAHTMIWHQNDPLDDVPIMAFQIQPHSPPTPPPATRPPPRTHIQQPLPPFTHFQSMIPINLWDHSTTMTMLSPKPSSTFSEPEINCEPITNSILLSPTPSLHDDLGDIASSPSNSSVDHMRMISDDEKDHFGLISLAPTNGSPQSSPPLFTVEDFIEMWSNSSSVTDDLSVVEQFGIVDYQK
ncbi:hypothetical protein C1645_830842 [Glomus cerebriforme]|uniref:Zn(2)-C6 fungal-type domain-containing protein n=1 Tax=Glomus cerebriforme TaxID=658196 RepID=A0A397SLA5_9GLOM|nr:hypothetical protein C1645_830842 [Glomus cerebriforme]